MTDTQPKFVPPAFEQSGLPQKDIVRKAYELVKQFPRALGSARVMFEMIPDPEGVAAHLVSFVNEPRIAREDIKKDFNEHVAVMVDDIRRIYDEKLELRKARTSANVEASFTAVAVWDTEEMLQRFKGQPLDTPLMYTGMNGEKAVFVQTSLEIELRKQRRLLEDTYLPIATWAGFRTFEARFRKTLQALDLKIAVPDSDAPAPAAKAKGPKKNFNAPK